MVQEQGGTFSGTGTLLTSFADANGAGTREERGNDPLQGLDHEGRSGDGRQRHVLRDARRDAESARAQGDARRDRRHGRGPRDGHTRRLPIQHRYSRGERWPDAVLEACRGDPDSAGRLDLRRAADARVTRLRQRLLAHGRERDARPEPVTGPGCRYGLLPGRERCELDGRAPQSGEAHGLQLQPAESTERCCQRLGHRRGGALRPGAVPRELLQRGSGSTVVEHDRGAGERGQLCRELLGAQGARAVAQY